MKKYIAAFTSGIFTLAIFSATLFSACTKEKCISEALKAKHQADKCPTTCPGVIGCDGKKYCTSCEAYKAGNTYLRQNTNK
ncbi:hypothetical protein [Polluticoccus soli]|uniref:hypothetical protein n=1 Tax=Polluticoccus soli TaxID=3034150 RepID=UPI0023E2DFB0|nr:hypothetical protein [Flavipsychrobacter sp. JY13-12]